MNVSGIARKASVAVSGIVGVALLVLVLEDRDPPPPPETEPKAVAETPPAPEPAPRPETAKPLAMATVALPPPPMPEPPKAQPAPPRPAPPQPAPQKPAKVVKPLQPQPAPRPVEKPVKVVKPMQPEETPPPAPPARTFKPLRPEPEPTPVVHKPEPIEPLRPAPKAEIAEAAPEPVEPLRPEPIKPLKPEPLEPERKPEPPVVETPAVETPVRAEPAPEEPPTITVSARTSPRVAKEGRALLRLLEHGSGPGIEISWPTDGFGRHRIYGLLSGCYGMRTVVMDTSGNLYTASGARARKWDLNLDRFSGFVRQPNGYTAPEERRQAGTIRRYHGMGRTGRVVRLFPRNVDALFLGGLKQALGERYKTARSIRAAYRQEGSNLFIEGIVADGVGVDGRIAFAAVASCR